LDSNFIGDLTKWPEVYAVTDCKAETVAQCFLGIMEFPIELYTIRAPEFLSIVLQEIAHLMGITQLPTSGSP